MPFVTVKSPRSLAERSRAGLLVAALALVFGAIGAGCAVVTAGMYIVGGGPKTPAAYKLDGSRTTVIFVDDRSNVAPRRSLRLIMAQQAEETLMTKGVLKPEKVISTQAAMRVAQTERPGEPMSIVDIGREVGADVVVYVVLDRFSLSRDGVSYEPLVAGRLKVFDAENNVRLFPESSVGHPFFLNVPVRAQDVPSGTSARMSAEESLARRFGQTIAELFYERERGPGEQRGLE